MTKEVSIIVPGGLNTDIIGVSVPKIVGKGELAFGGQVKIGPGGKSRNIAEMIAAFIGPEQVAMIGRTSRDPYNLWRPPMDALEKVGVNTEYVKVMDYEECGKYPGIALIPIDPEGNNQIYVLPGVNYDFCPQDIDDAEALFKSAKQNNGILALSLEMIPEVALYSVQKAREYGLKVIVDSGGINSRADYEGLINEDIFLIKPNQHEAKILTGIEVEDEASARKAAQVFLDAGIQYVMITCGKDGAYLYSKEHQIIIPIPDNIVHGDKRDETGCGDQTMATLCASIAQGDSVEEAAKKAIISGTLQFCRIGIQPLTHKELEQYI